MSDPSNAVAVAPLIADLAPYIVALIPVALGWVASELRAHRIINVAQDDLDKLDKLAEAEAGAAIAADARCLAGRSISVGSPIVAAAVTRIVTAAPDLLKKTGFGPDQVATMIAGKIGDRQNVQDVTPAAPYAVAPAAPPSVPVSMVTK